MAGNDLGPGFADVDNAVEGVVPEGDFPEAGLGSGLALGRQVGEDLLHLGGDVDVGVGVEEDFEDDFEGGDGFEGAGEIIGAAVVVEFIKEPGDAVLERFGMLVEIVGDAADALDGGRGDVLVVSPGVEVATRGASAARAEDVV